MRFGKHKRGGNLQLNMTPMIDCVFLLLIFFMTCAQVTAVNRPENVLPEGAGSQEQSESHLTINIDERGVMSLGGTPLSLAAVIDQVATEIEAQDKDPLRVTVILRVNRLAKSRAVNQVVEALEKLQVNKVRIAVRQPTP